MGIIIAAGALFTAVYDVLYKYNSSNTTNLNAAVSIGNGSEWGDPNYWWASGSNFRGNETGTMNWGEGTWMVVFSGQQGDYNFDWDPNNSPTGAICIAFYKGSSMNVAIGVGGGTSSYHSGSGKTIVQTNFAKPSGYTGDSVLDAIAGGAGGGAQGLNNLHADGTFAGFEGSSWETTYGVRAGEWDPEFVRLWGGGDGWSCGTPATQSRNGYRARDSITTPNGVGQGGGGGAGYFDGGAGGNSYGQGGGGSCTPWCYPLQSSDAQVNPGLRIMTGAGTVWAFRIDPIVQKPEGSVLWSSVVNYGETAQLGVFNDGYSGILGSEKHKPQWVIEQILARDWGWYPAGLNGGIRTGWVYSVSEDGNSWHGVGPDGERSETSDANAADDKKSGRYERGR